MAHGLHSVKYCGSYSQATKQPSYAKRFEKKGETNRTEIWVCLSVCHCKRFESKLQAIFVYLLRADFNGRTFTQPTRLVFRGFHGDSAKGGRGPLLDVLPSTRLRQNTDDIGGRPNNFYPKPGLAALLAVCLLCGYGRAVFQVSCSLCTFGSSGFAMVRCYRALLPDTLTARV